MNVASGVGVRRGAVGCVVAALVMVGGCTPRNIFWIDSSAIIQPELARLRMPNPHGYLVIAVPPNVGQPGDEEPQHYPPVYVYDKQGHFLEQLPNNTENPTALLPGEYIVLVGETDPMGEFHQVQVHVEGGQTTAVSLSDVAHAPRFWELPREFSN